MVSNASDDLPDPDRPVMTTSESRGSSTVTSLRLCSRAPETTMEDWGEGIGSLQSRRVADGFSEQTFASPESPAKWPDDRFPPAAGGRGSDHQSPSRA